MLFNVSLVCRFENYWALKKKMAISCFENSFRSRKARQKYLNKYVWEPTLAEAAFVLFKGVCKMPRRQKW